MGWFGNPRQVLSYLSIIGADRDPDGQFIITEAQVFTGLDGDIVISDETHYRVTRDGVTRDIPLAANMPASYGLRVTVI